MKKLNAQEVADMLGFDIKTVYRKAEDLGGIKFARRWLFDKDIVERRLFGGRCAEQEKEERQKT